MFESKGSPLFQKYGPPNLKMYLFWKFVGIVVGGTAGAILGGNAIVWLRDSAEIWREAFPPEGIIGAIGGVLLGGALAGGRIGALGVSLLIGTAAGLLLGTLFPYKSGLFILLTIAGLLVGIVVGLFFEIKFSHSPLIVPRNASSTAENRQTE